MNHELITEFEFELPKGYIDGNGEIHKKGIMRLATAADEILPLRDPRVVSNPGYLTIILLSRVITQLGTLTNIRPANIEKLFSLIPSQIGHHPQSYINFLKNFHFFLTSKHNQLYNKELHETKNINIFYLVSRKSSTFGIIRCFYYKHTLSICGVRSVVTS